MFVSMTVAHLTSHLEQELLILQGHLSSFSIFNVEGEYGIFPMLCKKYSVEENILICINDSNTTGVTCGAGTVDCPGAPAFTSVFKGARVPRSLKQKDTL